MFLVLNLARSKKGTVRLTTYVEPYCWCCIPLGELGTLKQYLCIKLVHSYLQRSARLFFIFSVSFRLQSLYSVVKTTFFCHRKRKLWSIYVSDYSWICRICINRNILGVVRFFDFFMPATNTLSTIGMKWNARMNCLHNFSLSRPPIIWICSFSFLLLSVMVLKQRLYIIGGS